MKLTKKQIWTYSGVIATGVVTSLIVGYTRDQIKKAVEKPIDPAEDQTMFQVVGHHFGPASAQKFRFALNQYRQEYPEAAAFEFYRQLDENGNIQNLS